MIITYLAHRCVVTKPVQQGSSLGQSKIPDADLRTQTQTYILASVDTSLQQLRHVGMTDQRLRTSDHSVSSRTTWASAPPAATNRPQGDGARQAMPSELPGNAGLSAKSGAAQRKTPPPSRPRRQPTRSAPAHASWSTTAFASSGTRLCRLWLSSKTRISLQHTETCHM